MSLALGRLQGQPSARRRKGEGSAARERARNARIALAGFVALGAAITFGVQTTWAPAPMKITSMRMPTDAASRQFADTHVGRLFFDSVETAVCREMQFNNDTGRMSDEKKTRCDDARLQDGLVEPPQTDARARAFSIRGSFVAH